MSGILVKCDGDKSCGEEFIADMQVETKGNIEKVYFECPHCYKQFISYYTNESIRAEQALIRTLKDVRQIEKLRKQIKKEMAELRLNIESQNRIRNKLIK